MLNDRLGIYTGCHPPYLLVLPHPRAQPETGPHSLHDLIRRRPRVARRVAFQPRRFPHSNRRRRRTYTLPSLLHTSRAFQSSLLTRRCDHPHDKYQFEASRLVMIQILLHGLKMDPLVSLHYYAPVCALINLAILPFTEGWAPFFELARIGPFILISNAAIAFGLNIAAVFLVGAGSGLVLTLAGVFKVCGGCTRRRASAPTRSFELTPFISSLQDILLITGSVLIFGSSITPLQVFGLYFYLRIDDRLLTDFFFFWLHAIKVTQ